MHKNILVGEGKNDLYFLHQIVTQQLALNPCNCSIYVEIRRFERDVACDGQKYLSLISGGGSNIAKSAIRITRPFWILRTQIVLGVVGDSDTGHIYDKVKNYLNQYINDRNRTPALRPTVEYDDIEMKFVLQPKPNRTIPAWTSEIPTSLEWQIEKTLKAKYLEIDRTLNDEETIDEACVLLGKTKEEVIRDSVGLLSNKRWFKKMLMRLRNNL